jgi:hypothetical protein
VSHGGVKVASAVRVAFDLSEHSPFTVADTLGLQVMARRNNGNEIEMVVSGACNAIVQPSRTMSWSAGLHK